MIEVSHLTKRYGSRLAVDDVSFTVEDGVIYGLLGPNGAGKSTIMNILTGYLAATEGQVTVAGHPLPEEADAAKACVGYLPEQPPLYPEMTVAEYLDFAAELKGVKKADRPAQVQSAARRTGLEDVLPRLIRSLSKGYRQRVGVAQALLGSPKLIILDEPTVGLDPAQVIELRRLIRELGRTHTVILFHGMMGYVLTAFLLAASGIYFLALNLGYGLTDFGYYTLYRTIFMLLLYFPVLAMRSLAEERRARTDQLLLTSPVSVWGIVAGKYLALCTVFALPCLADGVMIVVLWLLGSTASACGANFAALLCYFLLGCAAIAVCEFCSGLTENQIIAAVMGFSALLLAYMMPSLRSMFNAGSAVALVVFTALSAGASLALGLRTRSFTLGCFVFAALCAGLSALFLLRSTWLTEAFSAVLSALCLFAPFEEFVNNSFSIPTLVYYLTTAVLFLFFTAQGIEKRRWN